MNLGLKHEDGFSRINYDHHPVLEKIKTRISKCLESKLKKTSIFFNLPNFSFKIDFSVNKDNSRRFLDFDFSHGF